MAPIRSDLDFDKDGARLFPGAFSASQLELLVQTLADIPSDCPGVRLANGLIEAQLGPATRIAREILGANARPVRAVVFDKTAVANWTLGWHQDRTIVVKERRETPGFGPWSIKAGLQHVEPPFEITEAMVTLRIHIDPVDGENAPLLIACGSHRLGRLPEARVSEIVEKCSVASCFAQAGDVWLYATPILHASKAAANPGRRRVLQIDYSADALAGDLDWLGV